MKFNPNEYFKSIAISHKEIQHTTENPAFFREFSSSKILFDNSDFLDKLRYAKQTALVSQFNGDSNTFGRSSDNLSKEYMGVVFIISKITDKNIDAVILKTESIIEDIIAKIQYDSDNEILSPALSFKLTNIHASAVGIIANNYYGHAVFLNYTLPNCVAYNQDKWLN